MTTPTHYRSTYTVTECTDLTKLPTGTEVECRNGYVGAIRGIGGPKDTYPVRYRVDNPKCIGSYAYACTNKGRCHSDTSEHPLDIVKYHVWVDCEDAPTKPCEKTYFPIIIFIAGCNNPFKLIEKPEDIPTCTTIKVAMTNATKAMLNELDAAYRLGVAHGKNGRSF